MAEKRYILTEKTARAFRTALDATSNLRRSVSNQRRRMPMDVYASGGGGMAAPGLITAVQGTSHAARYTCALLADLGNNVVTLGVPYYRPVDTEVEITAAAIGDVVMLYKDEDDLWQIWSAPETIVTTSCTSSAGTGTAATGMSSSETLNRLDVKTEITIDPFTWSVTSGNTAQQTKLLYTWPQGIIDVEAAVISLVLTSPTVTNTMDIALSYIAASGTGTSLSSGEQALFQAITSSAISSGGTEYQECANAPGAGEPVDGDAAAKSIYLNAAPKANWTASDDITVEGKVIIVWRNLGRYTL